MPEPTRERCLTLLAFDFGLKRLGVAVGQSITQTAQPLATLLCRNGEPDWNEVRAVQNKWQANAFIVGLPVNKDGTDNSFSKACRTFAAQIEKQFGLPVHLVEERLSSIAAQDFLKAQRQCGERKRRVKKEEIDKVAAAVILQNWFLENN